MTENRAIVGEAINTIRGLSIDGVQKANSGHPGLPLGAAAMAYTMWMRHLTFNPKNPHWFNRDRFILSAGHGSMLLYSLLHLTGYDLPIEELMRFRQLHSRTPGHPENGLTPGVEMATGPLGQGISTATGFAIAEKHLAAIFNEPGHEIIDHYTMGICSDGDLMEGISGEAASLAGHLKLGKLIFLYDSNHITIDGNTSLAFTEDVGARYQAYGWHIQHVDGFDVDAIDGAIQTAKAQTEQPSLIICNTIIGFGSPNKANSKKAHGAPLGPDEVKLTKQALGIPLEPDFYVSGDVRSHFGECGTRGAKAEADWNEKLAAYRKAHPEKAAMLDSALNGDFGKDWLKALPTYGEADKMATRQASSKVLNALAPVTPLLMTGSADLFESNLTEIADGGNFQPDTPEGRNVFYGIREHAMGAAVNGICLHGGLRAIGSTFLIFSDYCRPSLRLAALMHCPSIFVFTHDSVGVGEDGPTHEPIEHLTSLRAIPNLNLIRPADANETAAAWKVALESKDHPTLFALSRQALPCVTPADTKNHPLEKGAYILKEAEGALKLVIIATGSEVQHALAARETLQAEGIGVRVVSMPSWFLFERQPEVYRNGVFPAGVKRIAMEAGATLGWYKYADAALGIDRFGLSAPGDTVMKELGMTAENLVAHCRALLQA
ncbi:MAG: transketolase [Armatimonadetes bacterium]|nr:transketolase [Armatimonadota bacterium]